MEPFVPIRRDCQTPSTIQDQICGAAGGARWGSAILEEWSGQPSWCGRRLQSHHAAL